MVSRSISFFVSIFVAVAIATGYSGEDSNTDSSKAAPVEVEDLGALLDGGEGAIVSLVAGETRLAAHRALLAARSAELRRRLLDPGVRELALPGVEGAALRQLLAHLYSLRPPQLSGPGVAAQLLAAADRYGLPGLKAACERQLIAQLSVESAAETAVLGVSHHCDNLTKAAIAYIRPRVFQVMATRGWADALHSQPRAMAKVTQLLSESPAESSSPAPADGGTAPSPATQPHGGQQTPGTAAQTAATEATAQTEDDRVSLLRSLPQEEKARRLVEAVRQAAVGEVEALLAAGADVGARDHYQWTALHWAAAEGVEEAVRLLLAAAAPVDARDQYQATPLLYAARHGRAGAVRLLLAAGAFHSARAENGWTPLHWAAANGHARVAEALLEAGADRAARNNAGHTPLQEASAAGRQRLVQLLEADATTASPRAR